MRTITTLLICLAFLPPLYLRSQDLIKEGILVLNDGETLSGEIRCRNWSRTPQRIWFRTKGRETFSEYGTAEVRFFEAGGNRYWRAEVLVDNSPVDYHLDAYDLLPEHSIPLEMKTIFLKCIVVGTKYDLLELVDNNKSHYYLKDPTGSITLLDYRAILTGDQDVKIVFGYRAKLSALNKKGENDPSIENAIKQSDYYGASLSKIVQALNYSVGKVLYKSPEEQNRKIVRFFAGAVGGITVSMPRRNWGFKTTTGNIAGIITGIDLSMGYSCNGGESFFRFDVLAGRMLYAASISDPETRRIHESLQYAIVPSMKIRLPLFTLENFKGHFGGGFTTPIHLSEEEKINRWKTPSSYDEFPWVAITIGGQVDFEIKNRWEIGLAGYQAPSTDFGDAYYEPIHYYTWIAYRF